MSLISDAMEECKMLDKSTVDDGYGGYITVWTPGATFNAAFSEMTPTEAIAAAQKGVVASYKITTSRAINLQYHDVLQRQSDGKIFRVVSDGDDKKTPRIAGLDMRRVNAEEWVLA